MKKRKTRTFTLPDDVYEIIRENAESEHLPMSRYLERLIWSLKDKSKTDQVTHPQN